MKNDNEFMARKIRQHLERRVAHALECKANEIPHLKLGTLCHFLFLLLGDEETIGAFHTSMAALLTLLGHGIVWETEPKEELQDKAPAKDVVN